jgi:penicillin-binding protein 2
MAMAYAAVANGGVSYYPRLVDKVLNQDGSPGLDENGVPVSPQPKVDADLRNDFSREQIEMVRRGLWKVVNEDGGTGGRARLKDVQVAGKTGTAQASTNGKKDTIAWFCCFAPFDQPKYVVAVMVQGGEHGGGVAAPIATRIMERTLAMDAGTFEPQVAWLAPAHHSNPFVSVKEVTFKDAQTNVAGADEEHGDDSQTADTQMAAGGGDPAVEPEADAQGRVSARQARTARALPVATPPQRQNFFQRLFGGRRNQAPLPTPPPARRPGGR